MASPSPALAGKIYALLIGLLGYGALAWAFWRYPLDGPQWIYTAVLSVLGIALSAIGTTLPVSDTYISIEPLAFYAAILSLNPAAAGLVAVLPIIRWRWAHPQVTHWIFLRNTAQTALMGLTGGFVYAAVGGQVPLHSFAPLNLLALTLALISVRLVNDAVLFGAVIIRLDWRAAWLGRRSAFRANWGVDALVYVPVLLTALLYGKHEWAALAVWLGVLVAAAFALYQLVRTRVEANRRLAELRDLNAQMTAHEVREAALARDLSQAAEDMTGYAGRMVGALHTQHTAMTQVTATVEELAHQAGYIAETAGAVDSTAELALVTAGRGRQAAAGSALALAELERNVEEMQIRMTTLEGRSRLIQRTLQTINGIAGETHLLALNATIEAAGAGEQGRRFSVVATQINALADQALRAAGEIQTTVREIDAATADTRRVIEQGLVETRRYTGQVDEAQRAMEGIVGAVGRASEMAQQIRLATQQQTQASSQVSEVLREIAGSLGTANNEGAAVSSAADVLHQLADRLRQLDERMPSGSSAG
ncbi:MAG: methyl-accepting chemotaxis protein [Chloroflexota bacterium]|nr:methyl-accepting chemotaxis protein [Chloroflexota bacterium]